MFGVAKGIKGAGCQRNVTPRRIQTAIDLLIPTDDARIEHMQRQQRTEVKRAVDLQQIGLVGCTDRHPLMVSLTGGGLSGGPRPLRGRIVIFGTAGPAIVGKFVIVPDGDHRHPGVQCLGVRIGFVGRMARPVIGEGDAFVGRSRHAPGNGGGRRRKDAILVFINIVAQMQRKLRARRDCRAIGIEIAGRIITAGKHRQLDFVDDPDRQRAGATDGRRVT